MESERDESQSVHARDFNLQMRISTTTSGLSIFKVAHLLEPFLGKYFISERYLEADDFYELYFVFEQPKIVLCWTYGGCSPDAGLIVHENGTFTLEVCGGSVVHTGEASGLSNLLLDLARGYNTDMTAYEW